MTAAAPAPAPEPKLRSDRCGLCRFFQPHALGVDQGYDGSCRKLSHPWPDRSPRFDWCGEFSPAPVIGTCGFCIRSDVRIIGYVPQMLGPTPACAGCYAREAIRAGGLG